jgi:hypothetical protein
MDKKSVFDAGAVWLEALRDFENELHGHVEDAAKDQQKFQDGRLFRCLTKDIKAKATGKDQRDALFACYRHVTNTLLHRGYGYDEVRRLHDEEMCARGLFSSREFCFSFFGRLAAAPEPGLLEELRAYVRSIASWMEAQESFSLWLVLKGLRSGWDTSDAGARRRAIAACHLSRLHKSGLAERAIRGYEGKAWSDGEWRNILLQAAGLTEKRFECTELEKWVWWAYPVFRRHRWNAREVLEAASRRGIDFEKEREGIDQLIAFQKYWIRQGLRFVGGKHPQDNTPPLLKFVLHMVLPDTGKMWGKAGGLLFLPKKKR